MVTIDARWAITHDAPRAVVTDEQDQVTTEAQFLAGPGGDLFACVHRPLGPTLDLGVVICPPVLAEASRNYRREWLLATALAQAGVPTVRFHYRGSGQSADASGVTVQDLTADACAVADHLATLVPSAPLAFVGTRLGALVAAGARRGAGDDAGPLVLWQPVVAPAAYARELHRARLMTSMRTRGRAGGLGRLEEALADDGYVDIAGYRLARDLHVSMLATRLDVLLGPPAGPLLVLEMNARGQVRPEVDDLIGRWRRAGHRAEVEVVPVDEPWWFGSSARMDTYEAATTGAELAARSLQFLTLAKGDHP